MNKRKVVVDTREQENSHLSFDDKDYCDGVINKALKTGDYSLEGLENIFCIERKRNVGEISGNITKQRFENEMDRMDSFLHPFIVCEFTFEQVCSFPYMSGIPKSRWRRLRVSSGFIIKRLVEIETLHKVKIIYAGEQSQRIIDALMRRMVIMYDKKD